MNVDVEEEAPRLRPLSGGIWTLFSWLRRSERSSSDESITSVGSDRTAASFDFLTPLHYKHATSPLVLPQNPLTETYKKRLHERNLRRQHDRDLTLRRKYGLYTEEGLGYDAFSLPPARKIPKDSIQNRQRRATSESIIQPRAAYVPGKRRAPLPPTLVVSASLPRNYKRKRPAPKPPVKLIENNKENIKISEKIQMSSTSFLDKKSSDNNNKERKVEKNAKKDLSSKDVKLRTEKSFLKQIFDNKKRNSSIDTSYIKVLPSISELDKQAAEIIQTNKSFHSGSESITEGNWICTNCLRKYNAAIISCIYCPSGKTYNNKKSYINISTNASNICTQTDNNVVESNKNNEDDEKKKLKTMLKEMKDSLPKRHQNNKASYIDNKHNITETEMPTLRIGSTIKEDMNAANVQSLNNKSSERKLKIQNAKDTFLTSEPSSSKQMLPNKRQTEARMIVEGLHHKTKASSKIEIPQSSCSSSPRDVATEQSVYNVKNPPQYFNKKILSSNKELKGTTEEIILNSKSISSLAVGKNNISTCKENESSQLQQEQKIVSNENLTTPFKISLQDNVNNTVEKGERNNDKIILKSGVKSENMKSKQKNTAITSLLPVKEIKVVSETSNSTTKIKNENVQVNSEILPSAIQKIEGASSKIRTDIDLNTPLKISSLLNPLYCPKYGDLKKDNTKHSQLKSTKIAPETETVENKNASVSNITKLPTTNANSTNTRYLKIDIPKNEVGIDDFKQTNVLNPLPQNSNSNASALANNLDHHARRRDLINQLEQSIAKGDEQTAAAAAAKLAKLKLSCSVLSFSSQIVSGPLVIQNKVQNLNINIADKFEKKMHQTGEQSKKSLIKDLKDVLPKQETSNLTNTNNVCHENKSSEVIIDKPVPSTSKQIPDHPIPVDIWIEDKEATRGPIRLLVSRKAVVGELKRHAEKSLGLQIQLQRWIIGKTLCSDDSTPLITLAGPDLAAPFYLCLVKSDTNKDNSPPIKNETKINNDTNEVKNKDPSEVYTELMKLEQQALVPNSEEFECGVCIEQCAVGDGVVLRECIHTFCRECLADAVRHCTEPVVSCPAIACPGALQEREIRALLSPEDYEKWLARSLAAAESGTRNTFHCRTRDCIGWAFCEPGVQKFPCPVCKHTNCLPCQAVHDGETCEQYQMKLREAVTAVETDQTDAGTQALLKSLIDRGEALECPECKAIITKKWGCDWIKCSACKTEICWVTKGRRWGPGGKGDTTGGCRCGIDGKRCHPSCSYCH